MTWPLAVVEAVPEVLVAGAVVEVVLEASVGELGEPGATGCRAMVLVVDSPAATWFPCDLAPVLTARGDQNERNGGGRRLDPPGRSLDRLPRSAHCRSLS